MIVDYKCKCGNHTFHLLQDVKNLKTKCTKCGEVNIICWNGNGDPSSGSMKRLDTGKWIRPTTNLTLSD